MMVPTKISARNDYAIAAFTVATLAATTALWWWRRRRRQPSESRQLQGELQCCCGKLVVAVKAQRPVHLVCYCDDCQGYVEWLRRQQTYKYDRKFVDKQGGVRVCQVLRSDLKVVQGGEHLQCTALDPRRVPKDRPYQTLRVHADCCKTPIFSACWRELPVTGFFVSNLKDSNGTFVGMDPSGLWDDKDNAFLPAPRYRICTEYAKEPVKGDVGFPFRFLMSFLWRNFVVGKRGTPCPWALPAKGEEKIRHEPRFGEKDS